MIVVVWQSFRFSLLLWHFPEIVKLRAKLVNQTIFFRPPWWQKGKSCFIPCVPSLTELKPLLFPVNQATNLIMLQAILNEKYETYMSSSTVYNCNNYIYTKYNWPRPSLCSWLRRSETRCPLWSRRTACWRPSPPADGPCTGWGCRERLPASVESRRHGRASQAVWKLQTKHEAIFHCIDWLQMLVVRTRNLCETQTHCSMAG